MKLIWVLLLSFYISSIHATPRLDSFDCLFEYAETYDSKTLGSSTEITGIESDFYYRYFDKTDTYLAVHANDNAVYLYQPQVSPDLISVGDVDYWLEQASCNLETVNTLPSSYENDHRKEVIPFSLPNKLSEIYGDSDHLSAVALADFSQNGELELVTSSHPAAFRDGFYGDGTPYSYGDAGDIQFWRKNHLGDEWIEITDSLLADSKGCMLPRKALVADFNGDARPDVFFSCTGHHRTDTISDSEEWKIEDSEAPVYVNEKPIVILSNEDGTYQKRFATSYASYAHAASAGDVNGDGFIDVVMTDGKDFEEDNGSYRLVRGKSLWFLFGNGDGSFELSDGKSILPDEIYNEPRKYFSLEIIDINNDNTLDIWVGGAGRDWILFNDGSGDFSKNYSEVPKAANYYESMDALKVNNHLYVYSINEDYSKPNYYWGDALTKIDLSSFNSQVVYEHEGYYRTEGVCRGPTCIHWEGDDYLMSWFPWIVSLDDKIRPLDSAFDLILTTTE